MVVYLLDSKLLLHGDWNCRRTLMLPGSFSVKGNDRSQEDQKKSSNNGISTNNKATLLNAYINVLGLSIKCSSVLLHILRKHHFYCPEKMGKT